MSALKAPFSYFGGKSRAAAEVWERFGDVPNYVEPFFGSGAVLLGRPAFEGNRIETINDADGLVANFWRALQHDPDGVAQHADYPVSELCLQARGTWLYYRDDVAEWVERLRAEPDFYDVKAAGWWVWFMSCWIGSPPDPAAARGRTREKLPHLGDAGKGVAQIALSGDSLRPYMHALAERLRRVRVCCGDWTRVMGPSVTFKHGVTGVFLDPPYSAEAERAIGVYSVDDGNVAHDVRAWCIENEDNPLLRIALCGYAGEGHDELEERGWSAYRWKANGGYGSQSTTTNGRDNAKRESIWFSPHCRHTMESLPLFAGNHNGHR